MTTTTKTQTLSQPPTPKLKQWLMSLTSGAVITLALASPATAQNNDTDAYDGSVLTGCAFTAITSASSNGRNGNDVSGGGHCIGDNADFNDISGRDNTIGANSDFNAVSGEDNVLGDANFNNLVSGYANTLGNNSDNNAVSGSYNTLGSNNYNNAVNGYGNGIGIYADYNIIRLV